MQGAARHDRLDDFLRDQREEERHAHFVDKEAERLRKSEVALGSQIGPRERDRGAHREEKKVSAAELERTNGGPLPPAVPHDDRMVGQGMVLHIVSVSRLRLVMDRARVDDGARSGPGLETHLATVYFNEHERIIPIERRRGRFARPHVAFAQLTSGAADEVRNPLLWFDSLVHMVVAREDDVDTVLQEQRFERDAQGDVPAMTAGIE